MRNILLIFLIPLMVLADTPPPGSVKAKVYDGTGSQAIGNIGDSLKVNVTNSGGTSTVNQGNAGVQSWLVNITNSFLPVSQSGVWNVIVPHLNSATDSVAVSGTIMTANPSDGTPGSPPPNSATQVAGSDGTNLRVLKTSSTGVLSVDASGSSVTVSNLAATQATNLTQILGAAPSVMNALPARITNGTTFVDPTQIRALSSGTDSVAITAASLPLPTGAATSANQTTANSSLASIDSKLTSPLAVTGTFFQATQPVSIAGTVAVSGPLTDTQLRATPVPVSGTVIANQGGAPWSVSGSGNFTVVQPTGTNLHTVVDSSALPTGAATSANQTTANTSLASIDSKLTSPITVTGPLTDTQLRATPVPVSGSLSIAGTANVNVTNTVTVTGSVTANAGTNLNTSALALESGGHLASIDTKTPALGQALAAASVPVVLTAAQLTTLTPLSTVAVTQSTSPWITSGSGNFTVVQPTGTNLHVVVDTAPTTSVTQGTSPWVENVSQFGGSAVVTGTGASGAGIPRVTVSNDSTVTANAGTNLNTSALALSATQTNGNQKTQVVDGANATVGPVQTISGTNYMPVVLAASGSAGAAVPVRVVQVGGSDGTNLRALSVDTSGNLNVNTTTSAGRTTVNLARNDYTSTNVTTAAYVQLIASTADTINQLYIFDSSGQTLFLAVGAAAAEVNKAYIVPGGNGLLNLTIPSGSRISVKAVSATANAGELNITFLK